MNRTDRLLAIILELQAKSQQRASDLAETFETSKRTIYRDIQALSEAGVPIVSMPGQGYSLMEGYFLPPLSFSIDEATMLLLGADVMARSFDAEYQSAAQWAGRKISGILPQEVRERTEWLRDGILFISANNTVDSSEMQHLQLLRRAIMKQQTVRFRYYARYGEDGQVSRLRNADPYGLVNLEGSWSLTAYCHLRRDVRIFRLSRMDELSLLPQTFTRPTSHMARQREQMRESRTLVVRVLLDEETARWAQEDRLFYITSKEPTPEGLLVTLHVRQEREIVQWLLGWGRHARVLEPESLRRQIAEEAQAILDQYRQDGT